MPLKTKSRQFDNFVVTGCTVSCRNDNLRYHQWRQSCQIYYLLFSVAELDITLDCCLPEQSLNKHPSYWWSEMPGRSLHVVSMFFKYFFSGLWSSRCADSHRFLFRVRPGSGAVYAIAGQFRLRHGRRWVHGISAWYCTDVHGFVSRTHWKLRVVMLATLSSLVAPQVVFATTCGAPVATKLASWQLSGGARNSHMRNDGIDFVFPE